MFCRNVKYYCSLTNYVNWKFHHNVNVDSHSVRKSGSSNSCSVKRALITVDCCHGNKRNRPFWKTPGRIWEAAELRDGFWGNKTKELKLLRLWMKKKLICLLSLLLLLLLLFNSFGRQTCFWSQSMCRHVFTTEDDSSWTQSIVKTWGSNVTQPKWKSVNRCHSLTSLLTFTEASWLTAHCFPSSSSSWSLLRRCYTRHLRINRMCLRETLVPLSWPSSMLPTRLEPLWSCPASANPSR